MAWSGRGGAANFRDRGWRVPRLDGEGVLGVLLLGGLREIERARNHDRPIDDDGLVDTTKDLHI